MVEWGGPRDGSGRKPMSPEAKEERRKRVAKAFSEARKNLRLPEPQLKPVRRGVARAPMSKEAKRQRRDRAGKPVAAKVTSAPPPLLQRMVASYEDVVALMHASARHARRRAPVNPFVMPAFPSKAIPPSGMAMDESALTWPTEQFNAAAVGSYIEGQQFLGYPVLAAMAQRPEYRTASEIIATECTRKWIKFKTTAGTRPDGKVADREVQKQKLEKIAQLEDYLDEIQCRLRYKEIAEQDGFFGRAHLFHDFSGGREVNFDDPELKTSIGSGRDDITRAKIGQGMPLRLQTIEAQWVYPLAYNAMNPLAPDWYNPQYWYVMGTQVHASRIPMFVGRPVPDMLKPAYALGGLSLSQIMKPYVDIWLQTRESVAALIHSFSVMVLKTNMANMMQPGGAEAMAMRAALFNTMRDNQGLFVIDESSEDFANVSATISGLHELQAQSQEHMFSVARTPAVKFAGIQPTGLNASSEGEIRVFYDTIGAYQQVFYRPNLTRTIDFAQMVLWGEVDNDIVFEFLPLWEQTEKEKADARKSDADTASTYIGDGVISAEEERERLASDADGVYQGIDPDDVPEPPEEEDPAGGDPFGGEGGEEDGPEPEPKQKGPGAGDDAVLPFALDAEWKEGDHPRGQPGNAGQFGSGGGGKSEGSKGGSEPKATAAARASTLATKHITAAKQDMADRLEKGGGRWGGSRETLADGTEIFITVSPRKGNSRGAARGSHLAVEYRVKKLGDEQSRRLKKDDLAALIDESDRAPEDDTPIFQSKREHAAHLLEKGTTAAELMKALGWPSISVPAMAKSVGMKLEKTKEGRTTTYKGTPMTAAERKAANIMPEGVKRSGGPQSRDQSTWSLMEFIVGAGGIDPKDPNIGDVRSVLGMKNKFIPGFGMLIRPGGRKLDHMRESAVEAGYIHDQGNFTGGLAKSTVATLLEAVDTENRGQKIYQYDNQPAHVAAAEAAAVEEENRRHYEEQIDEALEEAQIDADSVAGAQRERVIEIMRREGIADPLEAIEREAMEWTNDASESGVAERILDEIPGWDVPDDAGTASKPSGTAAPF